MAEERSPGRSERGPVAAAGRVAEVHHQTRPTLLLAAAFLLAAAIAGSLGPRTGRWAPLHLAVAGTLVLAVSGATQFLTVTWGASPTPPRALAAGQRWLVAAGAAFVVVGREEGWTSLVALGGACTAAGLLILAAVLARIGRRAVQARVRPAVTAYVGGAVVGVGGVALGAALGSGGGGHLYARLRDVHEVLNLLGLAGFVVAGTLPFFVATEARTKTSRRATNAAQAAVQAVLAAGLALAVAGLLARWRGLAAAGLVVYGASLVWLVGLLPRLRVKQFRWAGPRLVQTAMAIAWWIGSVGAAAVRAGRGLPPFGGGVVPALVVGAYVQLIVGSLAYLGPVLVGGGHERLAASFRLTRSWVGLVAGNVAAAAACIGHLPVLYAVAVAVWAVDGAARGALLVRARLRVVAATAGAGPVSGGSRGGRRRRR